MTSAIPASHTHKKNQAFQVHSKGDFCERKGGTRAYGKFELCALSMEDEEIRPFLEKMR